jgi:hypothetical protein
MRDVERWPEWTPSVSDVRLLDGPPFAVGRRVRIRQPRLPPAVWEVTELDDGTRSFSWVSRAPGLRVTGHHRVEPAGSGSRATLGLDFEGVLGPLWARLTRGITERYVLMEANGLKARSEGAKAGPAVAGA